MNQRFLDEYIEQNVGTLCFSGWKISGNSWVTLPTQMMRALYAKVSEERVVIVVEPLSRVLVMLV